MASDMAKILTHRTVKIQPVLVQFDSDSFKNISIEALNWKSGIEENLNVWDKLGMKTTPSVYELAQISHFSYEEQYDAGSEELGKKCLFMKQWKGKPNLAQDKVGFKILYIGFSNGFLGIAWFRRGDVQSKTHNMLVISFRGTKKIPTNLEADWSAVARNRPHSYVNLALTFALSVLDKVFDQLDYQKYKVQVTFTGHSLGGWLAQVGTFATNYLAIEEGYFLPRTNTLHPRWPNAEAVVFDSPGCRLLLEGIFQELKLHFHFSGHKRPCIRVGNYVLHPNIVNTINTHCGEIYLITLSYVEELVRISNSGEDDSWRDWAAAIYELRKVDHGLKLIIKEIEEAAARNGDDEVRFRKATSWPAVVLEGWSTSVKKEIKGSWVRPLVITMSGALSKVAFGGTHVLHQLLDWVKGHYKIFSSSECVDRAYEFHSDSIGAQEDRSISCIMSLLTYKELTKEKELSKLICQNEVFRAVLQEFQKSNFLKNPRILRNKGSFLALQNCGIFFLDELQTLQSSVKDPIIHTITESDRQLLSISGTYNLQALTCEKIPSQIYLSNDVRKSDAERVFWRLKIMSTFNRLSCQKDKFPLVLISFKEWNELASETDSKGRDLLKRYSAVLIDGGYVQPEEGINIICMLVDPFKPTTELLSETELKHLQQNQNVRIGEVESPLSSVFFHSCQETVKEGLEGSPETLLELLKVEVSIDLLPSLPSALDFEQNYFHVNLILNIDKKDTVKWFRNMFASHGTKRTLVITAGILGNESLPSFLKYFEEGNVEDGLEVITLAGSQNPQEEFKAVCKEQSRRKTIDSSYIEGFVELLAYNPGNSSFRWLMHYQPGHILRRYFDGNLTLVTAANIKTRGHELLVLSDEPGMGKTTALLQLAEEFVELNTFRSSELDPIFLPIFLPLKNLPPLTGAGRAEALANALALAASPKLFWLQKLAFSSLLSSEQWIEVGSQPPVIPVLLLDGLDEMSDNGKRHALLQTLREHTSPASKENGLSRIVIISTRQHLERRTIQSLEPQYSFQESYKSLVFEQLLPLTHTAVQQRLENLWSAVLNDGSGVQESVSTIIDRVAPFLKPEAGRFVGIPLQIKLLSEALIEDVFKFVQNEEAKEKLPLVSSVWELFHIFFEKKMQIYYHEKSPVLGREASRLNVSKLLTFCAFLEVKGYQDGEKSSQMLINTLAAVESDVELWITGQEISEKDREELNAVGLCKVEEENGSGRVVVNFIHRSLAEFVIAEFFYKAISKAAETRSSNFNYTSFAMTLANIHDAYNPPVLLFLNDRLAPDMACIVQLGCSCRPCKYKLLASKCSRLWDAFDWRLDIRTLAYQGVNAYTNFFAFCGFVLCPVEWCREELLSKKRLHIHGLNAQDFLIYTEWSLQMIVLHLLYFSSLSETGVEDTPIFCLEKDNYSENRFMRASYKEVVARREAGFRSQYDFLIDDPAFNLEKLVRTFFQKGDEWRKYMSTSSILVCEANRDSISGLLQAMLEKEETTLVRLNLGSFGVFLSNSRKEDHPVLLKTIMETRGKEAFVGLKSNTFPPTNYCFNGEIVWSDCGPVFHKPV